MSRFRRRAISTSALLMYQMKQPLLICATLTAITLAGCTAIHTSTPAQPAPQQKVAGKQGDRRTYNYKNGHKRAEGHYLNHRRVGPWSFWTEKGELHARVTYPGSIAGEVKREFLDTPSVDDNPAKIHCQRRHIFAVMSAIKRDIFRLCYHDKLIREPEFNEKLIAQWTIGLHGEVNSIKLTSSNLKDHSTEACVERVLSWMQFPPPDGGTCDVTYPFFITN